MKLSLGQRRFLKDKINKRLIFISVAWILLLLGWLFIEEPFGYRVSDKELGEFLIIMSTPLAGMWLMALLYKYLDKSKVVSNKYLILIPAAWIIILMIWLLIYKPFGSRISDKEIVEFLIIMGAPLVGLWLIGLLYKYLDKSKNITNKLNTPEFKKYFSNKVYNIVAVVLFSFIVVGQYQIEQLKNKITYMGYSISNNRSDASDNYYSISKVKGKVSDNEDNISDNKDKVSSLYDRISDVEQDVSLQSHRLHEHY